MLPKERVLLGGKSAIAAGARCTGVRANEVLVWSGDAVCRTWNSARFYVVRHMCLHLLGVMDRVDVIRLSLDKLLLNLLQVVKRTNTPLLP